MLPSRPEPQTAALMLHCNVSRPVGEIQLTTPSSTEDEMKPAPTRLTDLSEARRCYADLLLQTVTDPARRAWLQATAMPDTDPTSGPLIERWRQWLEATLVEGGGNDDGTSVSAARASYARAWRRFARWCGGLAERIQTEWIESTGPAATGDSAGVIAGRYVELAEAVYAHACHSDRYPKLIGDLVNAASHLMASGGCAGIPSAAAPTSYPSVTPRECVYREGTLRLFRYRAAAERQTAGPLLIIYALVNRPYMLDLTTGRSTIAALLHHGVDVYLIDWGYPDTGDAGLDLSAYIEGYIDRCVEAVRADTGSRRVNLLGICQGGCLALCYSAIHPGKVAGLITMVTPVDFHTPDNRLSRMLQYVDVDALAAACGTIPGVFLNWAFLTLRPYRLTLGKYLDLLERIGDPQALREFFALECWIHDSPDQAGRAFSEFIREFIRGNGLAHGGVRVGRHRVTVDQVRAPVLNIYARRDHIVPPAASRVLGDHIPADRYQELEIDTGHIGMYVSAGSQSRVAPSIARWLRERRI